MAKTAVCPWWAGYTLNWRARGLLHNAGRILGPYVRPGMTLLDIGCGMGYFTVPMAEMAGAHGMVIAADLQKEMLAGMSRNAQKAGVRERILPHLCGPDALGLEAYAGRVDFVLAFMMLHEVPDPQRLIHETGQLLRDGGLLLFAEPVFHVGKGAFQESLRQLGRSRFRLLDSPGIALCRAALLEKHR